MLCIRLNPLKKTGIFDFAESAVRYHLARESPGNKSLGKKVDEEVKQVTLSQSAGVQHLGKQHLYEFEVVQGARLYSCELSIVISMKCPSQIKLKNNHSPK